MAFERNQPKVTSKGFSLEREAQTGKEYSLQKLCRGEPRSPAEKRSFSDFPKENNRMFRLTATDFALAKSTGDRGSPVRVLF